ncbi:gamma-glutamyl-gamma-aminobutyrate hydrolase family protein [Mycobacterium sp. ACS4331]|uniref:gamma-glutamyl-gamma-aminobutyrate hydrolase family protein n=1 Tax=Mycobacterium sp. ACS4331 TaxID=1834121 RepID=UPI000800A6B4|nr:gamma-glutamyl-gamma-aminobutyrate hydrolase family protein [Mycobacterium sp. ACS4331]OBF13796.1 peptidase C26 [Mycobacterium sp. ACS4331]
MTPIIGICAAFERARWGFWDQPAAIVSSTYLNKIERAGGVAIGLIPGALSAEAPELILSRIDGLLLIGGVDLDPASYGALRTDRTETTVPQRDAFELSLAKAALEADIPVLGICRGMQILNVATGGTLHQHLLDAGFDEHRPSPGRLDDATFHDIEVQSGTHAAKLAGGGRQTINSHHHQGVDKLGEGAVVSARSVPDGLPEALEWPSRQYALGVQWHPEASELEHAFTDFVDAASHITRRRQTA